MRKDMDGISALRMLYGWGPLDASVAKADLKDWRRFLQLLLQNGVRNFATSG